MTTHAIVYMTLVVLSLLMAYLIGKPARQPARELQEPAQAGKGNEIAV